MITIDVWALLETLALWLLALLVVLGLARGASRSRRWRAAAGWAMLGLALVGTVSLLRMVVP